MKIDTHKVGAMRRLQLRDDCSSTSRCSGPRAFGMLILFIALNGGPPEANIIQSCVLVTSVFSALPEATISCLTAPIFYC